MSLDNIKFVCIKHFLHRLIDSLIIIHHFDVQSKCCINYDGALKLFFYQFWDTMAPLAKN